MSDQEVKPCTVWAVLNGAGCVRISMPSDPEHPIFAPLLNEEVVQIENICLVPVEELNALREENERLRGLTPEAPPFPPDGSGLPRYGLRWNGPATPLAVPFEDGYWTPWHLAEVIRADRAACWAEFKALIKSSGETEKYLREKLDKSIRLNHMAKELISTMNQAARAGQREWCESFRNEVDLRIKELAIFLSSDEETLPREGAYSPSKKGENDGQHQTEEVV